MLLLKFLKALTEEPDYFNPEFGLTLVISAFYELVL